MRNLGWILMGLSAFAALWKAEAKEDGAALALSPLLAGIAIGIFLVGRERDERLT